MASSRSRPEATANSSNTAAASVILPAIPSRSVKKKSWRGSRSRTSRSSNIGTPCDSPLVAARPSQAAPSVPERKAFVQSPGAGQDDCKVHFGRYLVDWMQLGCSALGRTPMSIAPAPTLLAALQDLTDPRCRRGVRHPFAAVLALTFLGLLCRRTD